MSAHATIQTTKDRSNPLEPSIRDGLLAATPSLRAFAMSLSGNLDRADDLVQDTLLRAIANIELFQPGTNLCAWLFTILHNLFRSEYRKRIREVEDTDGLRRQLKIISPAAQPCGVRGIPQSAREADTGPARSAHSRWRFRPLLRGGGRHLRLRGGDDQEPGSSCPREARRAALDRQLPQFRA